MKQRGMKIENASVQVTPTVDVEKIWEKVKEDCPNNSFDYNLVEKCLARRIGSSNGYELCTKENCAFLFWLKIFIK
jgi:hypothetical protein